MLCESGVIFELPAGKRSAMINGKRINVTVPGSDADTRQWVMPMRLPKDRPTPVHNKLWLPQTLEAKQMQMGVRFDFHGISLPPGAIERCVAAGAAAGQLLQCWFNGVLVHDSSDNTKMLLQLTTTDPDGQPCVWLEVDARGASGVSGLWRVLSPLVRAVREVLSEYPGVFYGEGLACPQCRSEGRWQEPTLWNIELQLDGGRKTHDLCQQCNEIIELLPPPPPAAAPEAAPATATPTPTSAAAAAAPHATPALALQPPPRSARWAEPPRVTRKYHAFFTHDWGTDDEGRDNHDRVIRVCEALRRRGGLSVWLDEDEMRGDVNQQMTDGIDDSACVVAFVTKRYIDKAGGKGPNGMDDKCVAYTPNPTPFPLPSRD